MANLVLQVPQLVVENIGPEIFQGFSPIIRVVDALKFLLAEDESEQPYRHQSQLLATGRNGLNKKLLRLPHQLIARSQTIFPNVDSAYSSFEQTFVNFPYVGDSRIFWFWLHLKLSSLFDLLNLLTSQPISKSILIIDFLLLLIGNVIVLSWGHARELRLGQFELVVGVGKYEEILFHLVDEFVPHSLDFGAEKFGLILG